MLSCLPLSTNQHWSSKTHVACEQPSVAVIPQKSRKLWHLSPAPIDKNRAAHNMPRHRISQDTLLPISFLSCSIGAPLCRPIYFVGRLYFKYRILFQRSSEMERSLQVLSPTLLQPALASSPAGNQQDCLPPSWAHRLPKNPQLPGSCISKRKETRHSWGNYRKYLPIYGGRLGRQEKKTHKPKHTEGFAWF